MKLRGQTMPVRDFKPADFIQTRKAFDDDYADELAAKLKEDVDLEMEAIIVFEDAESRWHVPDGAHRHKGYHLAGRERIPVKIIKGTRLDALVYALSANENHGLRRNEEDKRNAVRMALAEPVLKAKSKRELCRLCKVSGGLLENVIGEMEGTRPPIGSAEMKSRKAANRSVASNTGKPKAPNKPKEPGKKSRSAASAAESPKPKAEGVICESAADGAGEPTGTQASDGKLPAEHASQVVDQHGRPVPPNLVEVFGKGLTEIRGMIQAIGHLRKRFQAIINSPAGGHLHRQEVDDLLDRAQAALHCSSPYVACPSCNGKGCPGSDGRGKDTWCRRTGFVRKSDFGSLPSELKSLCAAGRESDEQSAAA